MKTLDVMEFRRECLSLLDQLEPEGLIVAKQGKPIARVLPYERCFAPLIGSLRKKIQIRGDLLSTRSAWQADTDA